MPVEAVIPLPQQSVDEQPPFQHCMDLVERLELLSQSVHHVHDDTESELIRKILKWTILAVYELLLSDSNFSLVGEALVVPLYEIPFFS